MTEVELLQEMAVLLYFYRKKKHYTLKYLAEETGHDAKFIRNLELGRHGTQIINYFKIAKKLNVPVAEIAKVISKYYLSDRMGS